MDAHKLNAAEVLDKLLVSFENGLTSEEAEKRGVEYGANKLRDKKKKTVFQRFLEQFKDVMIFILILAALISFVVAWYEGEGFFESILILLIVVLNAMIGVVQEGKAEKALDALKDLSAPNARVIRDGIETIIEAAKLVPGDIIILEAGDYVPADARIIRSSSLKVEESALTGESVPTEKDAKAEAVSDAPLGDRLNMLYTGTGITYGNARAVVTATGMNTEMGKIADLLHNEAESKTPLQHKLAVLGKYIGILAIGICALIFVIGLIYGMDVMEIFMIAVALAVSAIPEGLPAIVTIVLAIGVQRMAKRNAIIRKLPAVETLGSASVICSDKTGTLTQNQMTLVKAYADDHNTLEEISEDNSPAIKKLLTYAALCSDGSIKVENDNVNHIGDPTETSILLAAYRNGLPQQELNDLYPRLAELPFDSDRKLMTTVNNIDGKIVVIVKGAFDVLAEKCIAGKLEIGRRNAEELSGEALRILAVAYKKIDTVPDKPRTEELENDLSFMGLVGMIDPPRPEAGEAVAVCRKAGIKPVMITGDHVVTASAIARDLGILLEGDEAIDGRELSAMSANELTQRVKNISVYARVSPEDKIQIVRAWQQQGAIVSMTGDGVNDAPALKAADIGCAMGITGTDAAKGASDMILTDDNFATIVEAVREGRAIYDNIRKVVGFLLGTNIGEVLTVFTAMLIFKTSPLLAVHLLWINLVTDSLPAIALGMEPVGSDVMKRKPKPKEESIFAQGLGFRIIWQGGMFAVLTLIGFLLVWTDTGDIAAGRTMAFIVLALSQVFHSFNMRSHYSLFKIGVFSNKYLNGAAVISILLIVLIIGIPPLTFAFGLTQLSFGAYIFAAGLALVPIIVLEAAKAAGFVKP